MKKLCLLGALSLALSTLSGCSVLGVGEEEFACTGMPDSVYCHSARDVYEKTNSGVVPSPVRKEDGAYNKDCDDCQRAEDSNPELADEQVSNTESTAKNGTQVTQVSTKKLDGSDEVINNYVSPRLPSEPVPIRTPAQIMRIWVAPYVDTNGDLVAPGFVYTEIEPRRWIYPNDEYQNQPKMFAPLSEQASYPNDSRSVSKGENSLKRFQREQSIDR